MASLAEQIQSHIKRSIAEGYKEIKFGAGPVQLTYYADEGRGIIDVVADVEKNPYKLKEHFDKVRASLPEGEWELNPDTPQKQRIYQRWFRNDPDIRASGDVNMKNIGREGFVMTKRSNRSNLSIEQQISNQFETERVKAGIAKGDSDALSDLRNKPSIQKLLPKGKKIAGVNAFFREGGAKTIRLRDAGTSKGGKKRVLSSVRPGATTKPGSLKHVPTEELTKKFIKRVSGIQNSTPEKLERYFKENDRDLRKLFVQVGTWNQKVPKNQRISQGHFARLSKSIDSPRNIFIELLTENIAKGDNYSPNPAAMAAIGNPVKEGISPLENWARDYTTWLDKPENGGSGLLPQRGDYSELLEQKFNQITGEQFNKLSAKKQVEAIATIDDLTRDTERLNQFLPSEGAARRKWGILTPEQTAQAMKWQDDKQLVLPQKNKAGILGGEFAPRERIRVARGLNTIRKRKVNKGGLVGMAQAFGEAGLDAVQGDLPGAVGRVFEGVGEGYGSTPLPGAKLVGAAASGLGIVLDVGEQVTGRSGLDINKKKVRFTAGSL